MVFLKTLRLKSPIPQVRQRVVEKLAGSEDAHDTELLVASLDDESPQVRCAAVRSLESTEDDTSADAIVLALRDTDGEVRATAIRALGRRGESAAAGPLCLMLSDPCAEVREATAKSLRQLGWKPSTPQELAGFETALGKTGGAACAGTGASKAVDSELQDDTNLRRRIAGDVVKEANDPSRISTLLGALNDPQPSARISAINSLEVETDETVTAELLKRLRDNDANVRLVAAQVLARRPQPPPAHFLPLLKDGHFEIRAAAVHFLGGLAHPALAETLVPMLSDVDSDVRHATAKALGEMRSPAAIEALVIALADEDKLVRAAAEYSLQQIDPDWAHSLAALQGANQLDALLNQRPAWVRSAVIAVLEKIRGVSPLRLAEDEAEE